MLVQRNNFPAIINDNQETYFRYIEGIISSVDIDACAQFTRRGEGLTVRISPSHPAMFNMILDEIKKYHTLLGIHVEFSKSMKAGNNITYSINNIN